MVLRFLISAALAVVLSARADAVVRVWDGGAGTESWSHGGNWSPFGSPQSSDDVSIGVATPGAVTRLNRDFEIDSLVIDVGASVTTDGNRLTVGGKVDVGAAIINVDPTARLTLAPLVGSGAVLVAEDLSIAEDGELLLEGGLIVLSDPNGSALFNNVRGSFGGHGTVRFEDDLSSTAFQFFNGGDFRVTRPAGAAPTDRSTLRIESIDPSLSAATVIGTADKTLTLEQQTTLEVATRINPQVGRIELSPGSIFSIPDPASLASQSILLLSTSVLEVDAASTTAGVDSMAILRGGTGLRMTGGSEVRVNSGELRIENGLSTDLGSTITLDKDTRLHLANVSVSGVSKIDGDLDIAGLGVSLVVDHDLEINDPQFDWDGGEDATTTVNNGATLTVNAEDIESGAEVFDGTIQLFGGWLNTNIDGGWTVAGDLQLGSGTLSNSTNAADALSIAGSIEAGAGTNRLNGRLELAASAQIKVLGPATRLELGGVSEIAAGADFIGDGEVRIGSGGSSTVDDGVSIDLPLANAGDLHLSSVIGEAELRSYEQSAAGELFVQLAGNGEGEYDRLVVGELASLDGLLNVSLVDGFEPRDGDQFLLLAADTLTGQFDNVPASLPDLEEGLVWELVYDSASVVLQVTEGLAGDFNGDGLVDAADYTVWRDGLNQPGGFTQADYQLWLNDFGRSARSTTAAVPEPGAAVLLALAVACRRRR